MVATISAGAGVLVVVGVGASVVAGALVAVVARVGVVVVVVAGPDISYWTSGCGCGASSPLLVAAATSHHVLESVHVV